VYPVTFIDSPPAKVWQALVDGALTCERSHRPATKEIGVRT
jgi:uncharacterized protein YndB with AHSA1/START domain